MHILFKRNGLGVVGVEYCSAQWGVSHGEKGRYGGEMEAERDGKERREGGRWVKEGWIEREEKYVGGEREGGWKWAWIGERGVEGGRRKGEREIILCVNPHYLTRAHGQQGSMGLMLWGFLHLDRQCSHDLLDEVQGFWIAGDSRHTPALVE
jgi:hypothetical protein